MSKTFKPLDKAWMVALMAASLTACGGGGGGGDDPPQGGNPPAPTPSPPPPPPPPPSSPGVPPLSSTVVNIDDGRRLGEIYWPNGNSATGGQGSPVDGIECLQNMPDDYHVHTHISIFLNGDHIALPQEIGIYRISAEQGRCFYGIHTHDGTGLAHVEFSEPGTYTLGQLFQIWGQPLSATDVGGITGLPVEVFVTDDGTTTKIEDNWGDIELQSKREITIQIGTPIEEIPNVTWTGD
jgi:hypothetical protein